jgi:hypothetical protein
MNLMKETNGLYWLSGSSVQKQALWEAIDQGEKGANVELAREDLLDEECCV